VSERFYPKPSRYFATLSADRPLFQGDIIRGVFGAWWRHPESVRATLAGRPVPSDPRFPALDELRSNVLVRGKGYGMLLPQPCEFSEGEKGATQPFRVVAPLFPLDRNADVDHDRVRKGLVGHTLWVPRWSDFPRTTTSICGGQPASMRRSSIEVAGSLPCLARRGWRWSIVCRGTTSASRSMQLPSPSTRRSCTLTPPADWSRSRCGRYRSTPGRPRPTARGFAPHPQFHGHPLPNSRAPRFGSRV